MKMKALFSMLLILALALAIPSAWAEETETGTDGRFTSVSITLIPDQYAYYREGSYDNGEINIYEKAGYCVLPVTVGEQYHIETGVRTAPFQAPVLWFNSDEPSRNSYIGAVDTKAFSNTTVKYEGTVTVPEGASYMLVNTSNRITAPISVLKIQGTGGYTAPEKIEEEETEAAIAYAGSHQYREFFSYRNESVAVTLECHFPAGERVRLNLTKVGGNKEGNRPSNNKVAYFAVKEDGTQVMLLMDYAYAYPSVIIPENTVGLVASVPAGLTTNKAETEWAFTAYGENYQDVPRIITVKQSGGDYSSVRKAVESVTLSNALETTEIHIYPGVYNIFDDYTREEIESAGFEGLYIGDGVALIGIGPRENVVLHGELDAEVYGTSIRNNVSTLNLAGNCHLDQLTVTAKNIRYAIHDDTGARPEQNAVRLIENCVIRADNHTSILGQNLYNVAYGAGGTNLKQYIFKNCEFNDIIYIHTAANATYSPECILENCSAKLFCLNDYAYANVTAHFIFNNCNFGVIYYKKAGADQFARFSGTGNKDAIVYAGSPFVYGIGDYVKFTNCDIPAGSAVAVDTLYKPLIAQAPSEVFGISLGCLDGDTIVLRSGRVDGTLFGLEDLALGTYVGLDAEGRLIPLEDAENAIGVVDRIIGADEHAFIRLTF